MPEYFKFNHDPAHPNRLLGIPFTEMVRIQAKGKEFIMLDDSNKEVKITFDHDFYLGAYPITQALYEHVMGENPSAFKGPQRPVEQVSWNDIKQPDGFMEKLEGMLKFDFKFTLPTHHQWLYAASFGTTPKNRLAYAGSNDIHYVGWFLDNNGITTMPVGLKQPNEFGLYDLSGNVSEWLEISNLPFRDKVKEMNLDIEFPNSRKPMIYIGGAFDGSQKDSRLRIKQVEYPAYPAGFKFQFIGFRLCFKADH